MVCVSGGGGVGRRQKPTTRPNTNQWDRSRTLTHARSREEWNDKLVRVVLPLRNVSP
jgi:hypothetical protein